MYDFIINYLYFTDLLTEEALVSKCKYTDSLEINRNIQGWSKCCIITFCQIYYISLFVITSTFVLQNYLYYSGVMYDFIINYLYFTDLLIEEALVSKCKYTDSLEVLTENIQGWSKWSIFHDLLYYIYPKFSKSSKSAHWFQVHINWKFTK